MSLTSKIARRGFDEEDYRWFSSEALVRLQSAQEELKWLLDRGYKMSPVTELIGGHYQLSARQRTALQRSTATTLQCSIRDSKKLQCNSMKGKCIYIDGFNLIITLEVALSGSVLILGNDGCLRDLAGLRGTYRIIDKTEEAIELIGRAFKELDTSEVKIFLDSPVSNSGRLKSKILDQSANWDAKVEVELVPNADPILNSMESVVTSDSIILDECKSWINLSAMIVQKYINKAWIVNLHK
jgi:hypothetical protein